ncbi:MAG: trypsin-like peptidase domain-containing protein [Candidatus Cloacimonetes bacterium]|nr:trypsin-like peptidase domain-containing protein [Candidatus Cloacimonadota bacterium]
MKFGCFGLVLLILLNTGITLVLINHFSDRPTNIKDMFTENQSPSKKADMVSRENSITRAASMVEPAVVSVNVMKTEIVRAANPFGFGFFDFFGTTPMQRQVQSIGSGVIYDPSGYIVTNAHVVSGASRIKVVLPDKREFDAGIIGIDQTHDIAKIKISGNKLPYAKLGNSSDLIIGEWSIALGNPYGFLMNDSKPSVSVGVISALNRSFAPRADKHVYQNMIQTDAAVNPGNSGGPLANINGEVIGINTFIFSENGGNVGIGFAIPANTVKAILAQM